MKPFNKLTDAEKYKLNKMGMLYELYPEQTPSPKETLTSIPEAPEKQDHPEMVRFLNDLEGDYCIKQAEEDIRLIAAAWEKKMQSKAFATAFTATFEEFFHKPCPTVET